MRHNAFMVVFAGISLISTGLFAVPYPDRFDVSGVTGVVSNFLENTHRAAEADQQTILFEANLTDARRYHTFFEEKYNVNKRLYERRVISYFDLKNSEYEKEKAYLEVAKLEYEVVLSAAEADLWKAIAAQEKNATRSASELAKLYQELWSNRCKKRNIERAVAGYWVNIEKNKLDTMNSANSRVPGTYANQDVDRQEIQWSGAMDMHAALKKIESECGQFALLGH